jgi:hypothetical protein
MGATITFSIDLSKIDKSKVIQGKKGTYYNVTAFVNDDVDQFGNNVAVATGLSKQERESGAKTQYLGNGRVVSTDGRITAAPMEKQGSAQPQAAPADDMDFPF